MSMIFKYKRATRPWITHLSPDDNVKKSILALAELFFIETVILVECVKEKACVVILTLSLWVRRSRVKFMFFLLNLVAIKFSKAMGLYKFD